MRLETQTSLINIKQLSGFSEQRKWAQTKIFCIKKWNIFRPGYGYLWLQFRRAESLSFYIHNWFCFLHHIYNIHTSLTRSHQLEPAGLSSLSITNGSEFSSCWRQPIKIACSTFNLVKTVVIFVENIKIHDRLQFILKSIVDIAVWMPTSFLFPFSFYIFSW